MVRLALAARRVDGECQGMLVPTLGLLPLAAMLAALFAAVWIREAERERAQARSRADS
jgi:hypothetical protein